MRADCRKALWVGLFGLTTLLLAAGCKQSARDLAEQQALQRHQREVAQRKTILKEIRGPNAGRTFDGLRLLDALKRGGHLPGLSRQDIVRLDSEKTVVTTNGSWFSTQEAHIVTKPPTRYYGYVLVQAYSQGDFQLQKAWRADGSWKVLENYPILPEPVRADPQVTFFGPANTGAEMGFEHWYHGVAGGGSATIDSDNPAAGFQDFRIGITGATADRTSHADIRSEMFLLAPPARASVPLKFTFKYKLPGSVKAGDNIDVDLRFFGPGENNFIGQEVFPLGSRTADSDMTQYKTVTATNILPPDGAVKADVWIVANIGDSWTSGNAQFDDFSVTSTRAPHRGAIWLTIGLGLGLGTVLAIVVICAYYARRQRAMPATTI